MKYLLLITCLVAGVQSLQAQANVGNLLQLDTVYTRPTELAHYPGGDTAWKQYLKKNLKYPRKAWWEEVETDVAVQVVIDKDGKIISAQHLAVTGYGFEQEAVRLVLKSSPWVPARQSGRPVKSEGQLVINFRLR